ncbi:MAG: hypothetical protein Q9208_001197 [Pyrenodesmia sp. 3 TL-2023]
MLSIIQAVPPATVKRSELDEETVRTLEKWEALPLHEGSPEWTKAMIRFLSEIVMQGRFKELKSQGLRTEPKLLSEARCWLYKNADGDVRRFESLRQPFYYKELAWDTERKVLVTKIATEPSANTVNPEVAAGHIPEPETLRIFPETFNQLIAASASVSAGTPGVGSGFAEPAARAGAAETLHDADDTARGPRLKREHVMDAVAERVTYVDLTDDGTNAKRMRVSSLLKAPSTTPLTAPTTAPVTAPITAPPTVPKPEPKIRKLWTIRQWDPLIDGPDDDDAPAQPHGEPNAQSNAASTDDSDSEDEGYDIDEQDLEASPERGVQVTYGPSSASLDRHSTGQDSEGMSSGVPRNVVGPRGVRRARSME